MYKVNGGQQTVPDASEKPCSLYVASTVCDYTTILDNCMVSTYIHRLTILTTTSVIITSITV